MQPVSGDDFDYQECGEHLQNFKTEGEAEVYAYLKERQSLQQPKRNNVRKPPPKQPTKTENICEYCDGVDFYTNSDTSDTVCTQCGTVLCLNELVYNYDHSHSTVATANNSQINYFKERLSQWCMREPSIPLADRVRLRDTFNRGTYDRMLPKHEVRRLIIDSGLAPKKYVEKWLTIRYMLGAAVHPYPDTDALPNELLYMFKKILWAWKIFIARHPKSVKRRSLLNYNFLIHMFLLQIDVEAYKLYSPWFPLVVEQKQKELLRHYHSLCVILKWPLLEPVWQGDTLRVYKLQCITV